MKENLNIDELECWMLEFEFEDNIVTTEFWGVSGTHSSGRVLRHVWLEDRDLLLEFSEKDLMEIYLECWQ